MNKEKAFKIIGLLELIAVGTTVILDLLIPTLIIIGLMIVSLLIRKERISVVGFKKPASWPKIIGYGLITACLLQLVHLSVTMPVLNRITGTTIDYSGFSDLQGNWSQLMFLLLMSWTLAALGEEIVYRGYTQKLLTDLFGTTSMGIFLVIAVSSLFFGLAHLEQGLIGVVVTTIDAVALSILKYKNGNNIWAPIFAHGFYNTIGMVVFFLVGPIYGLW